MTEVTLIHASGDTFMPVADTLEDIDHLILHRPDLVVLTEQGEARTVQAIRHHVGDRMQVLNPDSGDILFLLTPEADVIDQGGPLALPKQSGPARLGGHGPRHNSFVKFGLNGEVITHTGVHFVTRDADHQPGGASREDQQDKQARLMAEQMQRFGVGHDLATGSGDLNSRLPGAQKMEHIFKSHGLTTTAQESRVNTPTHGAHRIDYIWTYDEDGRVWVKSMRVLRSSAYHSDHDPIKVVLGIRPRHAG